MLLENGLVTDTVSLPFRVRAPLYLAPFAIFVYVMLLGSFLVMIRLYISRRRWKRREAELQKDHDIVRQLKEKAENDLMHLSNEKLQSEIAHKTSQLANSTMAMVRKNEMLGELQSEIDTMRTELGSRLPTKYVNRLSKLIDQEMKNETEWELFEALYDQAHGDFFKRLKSDYPNLTPSDLRLCAYLRMNLASKEIAPLLNITVRGVEERRYRLRKRMNLNTDENLSERIMTY
jgi:DNA-binding CsgD family transcriptional regulator